MANTVIGLYNDANTAERVIDDLTDSGFNRSNIDMHRESDASGLHGELVDEGIPRDDADYYVEGLRDGGVLVSVQGGRQRHGQGGGHHEPLRRRGRL